MAEITPDHLERVAARLEASTRREVDQLRTDVASDFRAVHARISEVRDSVKAQNSRLGKTEMAIGGLKTALAVLRAGKPTASGAAPMTEISRPKLVAGLIAALAAVAAFFEVAHELGRLLVKALKP